MNFTTEFFSAAPQFAGLEVAPRRWATRHSTGTRFGHFKVGKKIQPKLDSQVSCYFCWLCFCCHISSGKLSSSYHLGVR